MSRAWLLGGLLLMLAATSALFEDVTRPSGIAFHHSNSKTPFKYLPEAMSGGVAVFDLDNDGWMDLYFVNGAAIEAGQKDGVELAKSDAAYWNRLYRNNGDGTFRDVTEQYGMRGRGYGMGVAAGDYDGDGYTDLLVTAVGTGSVPPATLYRNEAGRRFTDVTAAAGLKTSGWGTSAGFVDYDRDGDLDLFICRYVKWSFALDASRRCGVRATGGRSYCHPDQFEPISNYLFRNNGDGTFTDASTASGIAAHAGKALGVAFADYDSDGWVDISVANDSVRQFLFHNERNGSFTEVALAAGVALDEDGKDFGGMGTEFADLDDDGRPDILTTTISQQTYAYFHNLGDGAFEYRTRAAQLGTLTHAYTGWGMRVFDFDNDGHKDVFFANGHVMDDIETSQPHIRYLQPPLLLRFDAGKFVNVSKSAGTLFEKAWAGRGAAAGDLDNDGYLDLVVSNAGGPAWVARNRARDTAANNWIAVALPRPGATVVLARKSGRKQYAHSSTAASYLSAQDPRVFFGLGKDTEVESVTITWPGGRPQVIPSPKVNQVLRVEAPRQR